MDIAGMIESCDSRATTSAALSKSQLAPHYIQAQTCSSPASTALVAPHHQMQQQQQQQQQQHDPSAFSPFGGFSSFTGGTSGSLFPIFANNCIQQRPVFRLVGGENDSGRGILYPRNTGQGFVEELHSQSPLIKPEPLWNVQSIKPEPSWNILSNSPPFASSSPKIVASNAPANDTAEVTFGTEVDTLMKAIQAKSKATPPQTSTPTEPSRPVVGVPSTPSHVQAASEGTSCTSGEPSESKLTHGKQHDESSDAKDVKTARKRYSCTIENCTKTFYQKTHLDIHQRAHTGVKPYPCKEPGCGRSFSQLGNLKTHERRHTGERPYQCEICGKRFAQRGNVRAHKIVHDHSKPYLCRLDDCGKTFTQLGNLKSHQNRFHIATIRSLTAKFASIKDGDIVHAGDKELWEYFANLYKNSNKGIKGRGKDRRISAPSSSMSVSSGMKSMGVNGRGGYGVCGSGRSKMGIANGMPSHHGQSRGEGGQYDLFKVEDGSQSGSHSGGGSSDSTIYDDAMSDGYEDTGRSGDLAFGDRIY